MKTLILAILLVVSSISAHGEPPEQTINHLLRGIRAELPKGWTASYDKEHALLGVSREEAVLATWVNPNMSGDEKPERRNFTFTLRVVAAVHPTEHSRLSVENAHIQKKADALHDDLVSKKVSCKFDSFLPTTNEEKAAVAQYETLKKSLHRLPDFYFDDISLEWGFNPPYGFGFIVADDHIHEECKGVQEKVGKLLSKYEDTQKLQPKIGE
jgi:hypothetical protein